MMEHINLLWTGGLDSTFRLCELSRTDCIIQPYYIVEERASEKMERKSMNNIMDALQKHPQTTAIINDIKFIEKNSLKPDPEIDAAWKILNKEFRLGSQYEYLARVAKQFDLNLEVGLECSPRGKATNALHKWGGVEVVGNKEFACYKISEASAHESMKTIFGRMRFPKRLFESSKLEEVNFLKQMELYDIVLMTWFCHRPVMGMPCGRCNPCKDALNEGMGWRVPYKGRVLGFLRGCMNVGGRLIGLKSF